MKSCILIMMSNSVFAATTAPPNIIPSTALQITATSSPLPPLPQPATPPATSPPATPRTATPTTATPTPAAPASAATGKPANTRKPPPRPPPNPTQKKMAAMRGLVDVLRVTSKNRDDGYSDQYNRIFVIKILLVSSIITGVDYFNDEVNCMVPKNTEHDKSFFNTACWITGFYIFDEMRDRLDESSYYGIPQRVDFDGIKKGTRELCTQQDQFREVTDCDPMTRVYYLQYQWMPVYLICLCCFYYFPYILFRITNTDLTSLRKDIKDSGPDTTVIIRNYFNYSTNGLTYLRLRVLGNFAVKLLYVFNGCAAFYITDYVLLGRFVGYGTKYLRWHSQNNTLRHILTFKSERAQAGNELLPSMGFCDIHEASLEARVAFHNQNKFICELSPHILYQYVLMVIWFFFVAGIVISTVGACFWITSQFSQLVPIGRNNSLKRRMLKTLSLRELDYLDLIKRKDIVKYGDVMRRLRDERFRHINVPKDHEAGLSDEMELDKFISSLII